jgi:hypothetical protein
MEEKVSFLKAHWTLIVSLAVAIWGVVGTQVQAYVTAHPSWTVVIGVIGAILAHLSPSPVTYWKGEQ